MLNQQEDYTRPRNYWKYLKSKLKKDAPELVSATNQLKLNAADGKKYSADVMDSDGKLQRPCCMAFGRCSGGCIS